MGTWSIVVRGVGTFAVEEAMFNVLAVDEIPDDLPVVVDAGGYGAVRAVGLVERLAVAVFDWGLTCPQ
jgi:hypothetical protein